MYTRIMVVDDDEVNNFVTEKFLYLLNPAYEVSSYANPVKAWHYLQEQKESPEQLPQIILLDINMPAMDGFEFLANLSKENLSGSIQVIMYSSSTQLEDRLKAMEYTNVIGYMEKPFNTDIYKDILATAGCVEL
jgi:CheY-like chemotaxis protein